MFHGRQNRLRKNVSGQILRVGTDEAVQPVPEEMDQSLLNSNVDLPGRRPEETSDYSEPSLFS